MPFSMFEELNTRSLVMDFFKKHFNDSIPLIGEERLLDEYFNNPRGALISIKVRRMHRVINF
jgi:kynurenine 3-monooxygenase